MNEYEKTEAKIQEELISRISESVADNYPFIRFWKPEERVEDDEILEKYETIYSIEVRYEYPKATKIPVVKTFVMKDFRVFDISNRVVLIILELDPEILSKLRIWSRHAAHEVYRYFLEEELYYLKAIRFDFLPENKSKTKFAIPNLALEHIQFSQTKKGKVIPTEAFVKSKILSEDDIKKLLESSQKNSS
ncbi:MAG: hypothetical protein IKF38_02330 [Clostridia bacterium]|nr:hypothetical protein [Clostridia bacterium]